jgi:hypothetical protein
VLSATRPWDVAGLTRYVIFVNGAIYWSPVTGARPVTSAIYDAWATLGYERGPLGLPTSGEIQEPEWIVQNFQHGTLSFDRQRRRWSALSAPWPRSCGRHPRVAARSAWAVLTGAQPNGVKPAAHLNRREPALSRLSCLAAMGIVAAEARGACDRLRRANNITEIPAEASPPCRATPSPKPAPKLPIAEIAHHNPAPPQ